MFIKITWDEVGGRVGINRGRKAPYFTRHFDGFPALIPSSTGSMVSLIPSFITYQVDVVMGYCGSVGAMLHKISPNGYGRFAAQ
jgi:hypothetical protein